MWDQEKLRDMIRGLGDIDLSITGFDEDELDALMEESESLEPDIFRPELNPLIRSNGSNPGDIREGTTERGGTIRRGSRIPERGVNGGGHEGWHVLPRFGAVGETPQGLFDQLDATFHFTLDACADATNYKVAKYFDEAMDALSRPGVLWRVLKWCG